MDGTTITNLAVSLGAIAGLLGAVRELRDVVIQLLATLLRRPELADWWRSVSPRSKRILAVVSAVGLFVLISRIIPGPARASIAQNCSQQGCAARESVKIEWRNLPLDSALCVAVYSPEDSAYFPEQMYLPGTASGTWTAPVELGSPTDNGKTFQITVWLLDKAGHELLQAYMNDPFRAGFNTPPAGLRSVNTIEIKRR